MKKNIVIAACLLICLCVLGLVACAPKDDNGHTHKFSDKWTYDETNHWHAATCEHSDEVKDKSAHTFEGIVCTVCGYEIPQSVEGTYYLFENEELEKSIFFTFTGDTWRNDENQTGTFTLNGSVLTLYINVDGSKESFCSGSVNDKTITLNIIGANRFYKSDGTSAEDNKYPSLELSPDGAYYTVVGIGDLSGDSVIPATYKKKPVTSIGDNAFEECIGLTSIVVPESVTSIGRAAFKGCNNMKKITLPFIGALADETSHTYFGYIFGASSYRDQTNFIPESLKTVVITKGMNINQNTFYGCSSLMSVTIGNGVTSIGENAFNGCGDLTSIVIPDSVTNIASSAFDNTAWYNNQPDGLVYAGKAAYKYKGTMPANTAIAIKDGTLSISASAFAGCNGLTSITIPDSVTSIWYAAFWECSGIIEKENGVWYVDKWVIDCDTDVNNVVLRSNTVGISEYAFWGCNDLTSIVIPDGVTSIGNGAFYECSSLTSITIPDSVTSIGKYAFYGCSGLTSIVIPNSVTSIEAYTFDGCSGLTNIVIPDSVTSIGKYAFYQCNGLTSVTIGNGVRSIGADAFYGCSGLTSITIPDSVKSIGQRTFYNCGGLTSVTIGNGVKSIGRSAFWKCSGLTSIVFDGIKAQWQAIIKGTAWNSYTGNYTITCTDGTINK